ncbi:hypothetical protein CR513_31721, partial [Mucuna pruriens]
MFMKGAVLNWYTCLPPNSIDSFTMLMEKFGAQYAKQEEDESLCSFMEHFLVVVVKIRDLNSEVSFHSMIMALKPSLFLNSLCK